MAKATGKAAKKNPRKDPFNGAPLTPGNPGNSGGKKGRSGRPPKAFKEFCAGLAADPEFQQGLRTAATSPGLQAYAAAVKLVLAYGEGLPTQEVKHAGEVTHTLKQAIKWGDRTIEF